MCHGQIAAGVQFAVLRAGEPVSSVETSGADPRPSTNPAIALSIASASSMATPLPGYAAEDGNSGSTRWSPPWRRKISPETITPFPWNLQSRSPPASPRYRKLVLDHVLTRTSIRRPHRITQTDASDRKPRGNHPAWTTRSRQCLLQSWHLPDDVEAVATIHTGVHALSPSSLSLIHTADCLAHLIGPIWLGGLRLVRADAGAARRSASTR